MRASLVLCLAVAAKVASSQVRPFTNRRFISSAVRPESAIPVGSTRPWTRTHRALSSRLGQRYIVRSRDDRTVLDRRRCSRGAVRKALPDTTRSRPQRVTDSAVSATYAASLYSVAKRCFSMQSHHYSSNEALPVPTVCFSFSLHTRRAPPASPACYCWFWTRSCRTTPAPILN